tara:strand:+ start:428 stop:604 length:177 start_codon:yes stop_codon:yes gene_type:complete
MSGQVSTTFKIKVMSNIEKLRLIKELVQQSPQDATLKCELMEYLSVQIDIEVEYILDK